MRLGLLATFTIGAIAAEPEQTVKLRALMASTPLLPHRLTEFRISPPLPIEMVSSAAVSPHDGLYYLLQRGEKTDPVVVATREGKILRTWGRGYYKIPHSIRIDAQGNVWTVDAGDSTIRKFTPLGRQILKVSVELPAKPRGAFCGAADIAFAPNGHFFIADGYQNTRVVEFDADGKRIGEWGKPGTGPGELDHPHGIAIDPKGIVYVADRENGRIQRFDMKGNLLGFWDTLGKTFCLKLTSNGDLWIGTQPRNVPNGAEGWLVKVDTASGKPLGRLDSFGHSVDVTATGEVLTGRRPGSLLVFRP
jgi:DNA-binding beta-propeller fold protein YncE